jgi:hypothetical protein
MSEGLLDRDLLQLLASAPAKRTAASREHDPRNATRVAVGAQALMNRAVLAVDGDELGAWGASSSTHDWSGSK